MARKRYKTETKSKARPKPLSPLLVTSEKHALELARNWFLELEQDGAKWWQEHRQQLSEGERNEILSDLWHRRAAITGGGGDAIDESDFDNGNVEVRLFLQTHHFTMDEKSDGFCLLARLFREARLEYLRRQQDRVLGKAMQPT